MWFEILPSCGIIFAALGLPHLAAYGLNKLFLGNSYRRSLIENMEMRTYLRDWRLTGKPYVIAGLENIPDE